jgi:hypothetical protein
MNSELKEITPAAPHSKDYAKKHKKLKVLMSLKMLL